MKSGSDFPPSSSKPLTQPMGSDGGKALPISTALLFISYHGFEDAYLSKKNDYKIRELKYNN